MTIETASRVATIAELNDKFRKTFMGGKVLLTHSVATLDDGTKAKLIEAIRAFSDFKTDNDPAGEHDFVSVEVNGERYFAKIDCYAPDMEHGSEDPADPAKTVRVLTIMHCSDY
jgi:Protein of unknown function (DUF3768)